MEREREREREIEREREREIRVGRRALLIDKAIRVGRRESTERFAPGDGRTCASSAQRVSAGIC